MNEAGQSLTFGNFVRFHDYDPEALLSRKTWTQWKASARLTDVPTDPDIGKLHDALIGATQTNGPREISRTLKVIECLIAGDSDAALAEAKESALVTHYRLWGKPGPQLDIGSIEQSFQRLTQNPTILRDLQEVLAWSNDQSRIGSVTANLPFPCSLEIHANYGADEIKAALGGATFESAGDSLLYLDSRLLSPRL